MRRLIDLMILMSISRPIDVYLLCPFIEVHLGVFFALYGWRRNYGQHTPMKSVCAVDFFEG